MKKILSLFNKGVWAVIKSTMTLILVFISAIVTRAFILFFLQKLNYLTQRKCNDDSK